MAHRPMAPFTSPAWNGSSSNRLQWIMDSEHEFESLEYVRQWTSTADTRRPQRPAMFRHIAALVADAAGDGGRVLELGCGPGALAEVLLRHVPGVTYVGLDYSPAMLTLAHERLDSFGARARLHRIDLRNDGWTGEFGGDLDAIVTNQALHDLGTTEAVGATYARARPLLRAGGLFVNAELVIPPGSASEKPGKLPADRHVALLAEAGFVDVRVELDFGDYVCLVGRVPAR
jgi:cyclopropane fatty-acyl-phospholipid synthase-like methyltransferase